MASLLCIAFFPIPASFSLSSFCLLFRRPLFFLLSMGR